MNNETVSTSRQIFRQICRFYLNPSDTDAENYKKKTDAENQDELAGVYFGIFWSKNMT